MKLDVNVNLVTVLDEASSKKLDVIINMLKAAQTREEALMAALDELVAKVAANGDAVNSAVVLLQDVKAKLDEAIAANDPAKLQELSDALGAQTQKLADAIVANTPAAPEGPA